MEGGPKFNVTKRTEHGPHLERVREPGELDDKQQADLREALSGLGVQLVKKKPKEFTRRGFLTGTIAAGAVALSATKLGNGERQPDVQPEPAPVEEVPEESLEEITDSNERFDKEISGYKAFTLLKKDEVLYLNADNEPVGEPVVLEEFDSELPEGVTVQEGQAPIYHYSIGEVDATGLPIGSIPPRWLNYKQAELQAMHPDNEITRRMNVIADFQAAHREDDEPELVAAIESGEIDSYDEIVSYFAEKPVRGAEEFNRMEYARSQIEFRSEPEEGRPAVPELVQSEFRKVVPGLFAQESKFNAGLTSSTGAKGLAQIMPETWEEYRGTQEVSLSMVEQLDVAGKLISDNYHYITHFAGEEALGLLRMQFDSEEDFDAQLIVPLMINAYNAGGPLIGIAVKKFVEETPSEDLLSGKDLFLQFADFAQQSNDGSLDIYKVHAREYVSRVYGNVAMLEEKYSQQ